MSHVATVTIDSSKVAGDLTDYPVYIDLSDLPSSFWDVVANGGGDIRVYKNDDSTELAREVVFCDTATDTGELHVLYSGTLSGSSDTDIHIYADGSSTEPAADSTYGSEAVWDDYYGVFHFQESSGTILDSTANDYDSTAETGINYQDSGKLAGYGIDFTMSSSGNRYIDWNTTPLKDNTSPDDVWSWQSWFYIDGTMTSQSYPNNQLYCPASDPSDGEYFNSRILYDSGNTPKNKMLFQNSGTYPEVAGIPESTWNMFHGTKSGSGSTGAVEGWWNGVSGGTGNAGTATNNANTHKIGRWFASTAEVDLKFDEHRLRKGEMEEDQVETEYENQNSPSTFYTAAEAAAGSSFIPKIMMS